MSTAPRLLLVDDDAFVRELLKDALLELGTPVTVLEAADGEQALELARREQPAVVLLDLFMPRRSGLDVLGELATACPGARVVVVSSMDAEPVIAQALAGGALDFVTKPFHPLEVVAAVRRALAR